jgi:hypothetical protein
VCVIGGVVGPPGAGANVPPERNPDLVGFSMDVATVDLEECEALARRLRVLAFLKLAGTYQDGRRTLFRVEGRRGARAEIVSCVQRAFDRVEYQRFELRSLGVDWCARRARVRPGSIVISTPDSWRRRGGRVGGQARRERRFCSLAVPPRRCGPHVKSPKGGDRRTIPMTDRLKAALQGIRHRVREAGGLLRPAEAWQVDRERPGAGACGLAVSSFAGSSNEPR